MSKKVKGSKSKGKSTKKGKGRAEDRGRHAHSQTLPGLEQTRDTTLVNCCEDIAAAREAMNAARLDEKAAIQRAIKRLLAKPKDQQRYRHGGVELALVEGVDKLRVRLTKDAENTASSEGDEAGDVEHNEELGAAAGDTETRH